MSIQKSIFEVTIRGFQSIETLERLRLSKINILVGPNGAGKSNFINYFRMLRRLVDKGLQTWVSRAGGADRVLTFGVERTHSLYSNIAFGRNDYGFSLSPSNDEGLVFEREWTLYVNEQNREFLSELGSGHRESLLRDLLVDGEYSAARYCYDSIKGWRTYHFHDTSNDAPVKRSGSVDDYQDLRENAENLAAFLYHLQSTNNAIYEQIRRVVGLAVPHFDDFILRPQSTTSEDKTVRLLWRQKDSDYPQWPTQLSDGSLRFICLATALLQPNPPSTIIIDEPELGLHPYAISLLGSLMRSASSRMQIIASTQSVQFLSEFSPEDVIVVDMENGRSKFSRLDSLRLAEWLTDYSLGELWQKNLLGGRPS